MGLLFAIIALSLLIFFHELGHFLFAKFFGVKVETFSIGFGKKLLYLTYKNTQYTISAIPLGGYVKLKGEVKNSDKIKQSNMQTTEDSKSKKDSLLDKHPLKRIIIYFAGPLFNFIIAFILYFAILTNGVYVYSDKAIIGEVSSEYKSFDILKANDEILSIENKKVSSFDDISVILNNLRDKDKKEVNIVILRQEEMKKDKQQLILNVPLTNKDNKLLLGITPILEVKYLNIFESIKRAYHMTIDNTLLILNGLRDLILGIVGIDNLRSIIGITDISTKAYNTGFINFILIIALISINLAIINLLPLPMLDGGQIIFTFYEWITNKTINEKISNILVIVGFSFIMTLMLIGTYNDIVQLIFA